MVSSRRAGQPSHLRTDEPPLVYIAPSPNLVLTGTWERGVLISTALAPSNGGFYCSDTPLLKEFAQSYAYGEFSALSLPLNTLSPFTRRVLLRLQKIPFGTSLTYRELATELGSPGAARAVGSACGRNPFILLIPCHRIVGAAGLGGFSAGLELKKILLDFERK